MSTFMLPLFQEYIRSGTWLQCNPKIIYPCGQRSYFPIFVIAWLSECNSAESGDEVTISKKHNLDARRWPTARDVRNLRRESFH